MIRKLLPLLALCLSFAHHSFAQCSAQITPAGPLTVCEGDVVTLSATPGGDNYDWIVNGALVSSGTANNITVITSSPNTLNYQAVVIFGSCTTNTNNVVVTVNDKPDAPVINSNAPVCAGQTLSLVASTVPGGTYFWESPCTAISTQQNWDILNVLPCFAGTFTITVTANGCTSDEAYLNVSVNTTPPPVVYPLELCQYSTQTLTAIGSNLLWYTVPVGGIGSPVAPSANTTIPSTITWYVSQTLNGCESERAALVVDVLPQPTPPLTSLPIYSCQYDPPFQLTATGVNLMWYDPFFGQWSFNAPYITNQFPGTQTYSVTQTVNGCESNIAYTQVSVSYLCDSVWPGDVNYDLIANNDDVLDLGLYYGETGQMRSTISINWSEQISQNWGIQQVNFEDMKHADCNGDGIVDVTDADAITLNYGLTHLKGTHTPQAKSTAFPDLYFDLTGINFVAGTTVNIPIKLGTSAMPMNNILCIAAKIHVTNVTLDNAPTISNATSWMGNSGNTINFTKGVSFNQTDWAYVRTDHANVSGEGTIAMLTMEIPANAPAQDAILYFDNVKMINSNGDVLTDYNVVDDTATIVPVSINSTVNAIFEKAAIVPNPSDAQADLQITLAQAADVQVTIADMTGKKVWGHSVSAVKGLQTVSLPSAQLASGVYHIMISTDRANIAPIKWIKK